MTQGLFNHYSGLRWLGIVLLLALLCRPTFAEEPTFQLNMQDADIRDVIDMVARVTGESFIVDPRVRGQVTVISDRELTAEAIYEIFLATIEVYGFSAVETDNAIKIIAQADVKASGLPVDSNGEIEGERIITRVFPIQNTSAMELVPILRPLVASYGHLAGVNTANALIISDRATNIERVAEIVELLDKAGSEEIEVVALQYAWVGNVIQLLERISPTPVTAGDQNGTRAGSRGVHLVGDERSNRIIIRGEDDARAQIINLIRELDIPAPENSSSKVIFLNNADAARMAELLTGLAGSVQQDQNQGGQAPPSSSISILPDEQLNALVVRAEPSVMNEIESIIRQLDVRRKQVLIEAAIVEVSGDVSDALGVQWATNPDKVGDGVPFAASNFNESGAPLSDIVSAAATSNVSALPNGAFLGLVDPGSSPNFGAIIQAIESQSNTNVLSTPSVMTLDNSEAFITVGSSVPFKTGGNGTDDNPFVIERQDVGTTLTVIPHVQQDGLVRMEVDQVVESISANNDFGAVDIVTNKRQVQTEVLVNNGSTIVLGGLIDDTLIERESRVPLLGRIPILGVLFRSTSTERQKTNLLVVLRPTVVEGNGDDLRDRRLSGIWDIRIQTLDSFDDSILAPTVDDLFEGRLDGGRAEE
ncbi:type II secretion system secretin GspD [Saccharospirillum mangrovi]|uniref:type II secretion system secretin GspD n=1 Tax=Saccharospirillum mangrovi TaxID=2161747 RepID=UPI000D372D16|nr:type II secretion system secretin GspD [Saccharospirillum mangrovi]